jgi:hypothetical protein
MLGLECECSPLVGRMKKGERNFNDQLYQRTREKRLRDVKCDQVQGRMRGHVSVYIKQKKQIHL